MPCPWVHSNDQETPCAPCSCWEARLVQPAKPVMWGAHEKHQSAGKRAPKAGNAIQSAQVHLLRLNWEAGSSSGLPLPNLQHCQSSALRGLETQAQHQASLEHRSLPLAHRQKVRCNSQAANVRPRQGMKRDALVCFLVESAPRVALFTLFFFTGSPAEIICRNSLSCPSSPFTFTTEMP